MTAPDLESVIAAALVGHSGDRSQRDFWLCCACGTNWPVDGPYVSDITGTLAAHQARAVLAALAEAGTVEWGVVVDGLTYMFGSHEFDQAKSFTRTHDGALSQRTKAGPWTAVTE